MKSQIREISLDELEQINGGVDSWGVLGAGLSGAAGFGGLGMRVGALAGPGGALVGGLIGAGFGAVGAVYTYLR